MEKILGLDLGSRTCGIAMSDALGMIAHGVETYRFEENNYKSAARHIQKIVEEKINELDLEKLEEIIIKVAKKELKHIEILGLVLGAVIGVLQGILVIFL